MTRWTFRILGLLILYSGGGVVTIVGVSWGIGVSRGWENAFDIFRSHDENCIATYVVPAPQTGMATRTAHCARGLCWSAAAVTNRQFSEGFLTYLYPPPTDLDGGVALLPSEHDLSRMRQGYYSYAFGWPCYSMQGIVGPPHEKKDSFPDNSMLVIATDPFEISRGYPAATTNSDLHRLIPLRPIFPGFIINTLVYAAVWFGIFFGVGFVKRVLRRKRGRCVKCSYDLRGEFDRGCPECGWGR